MAQRMRVEYPKPRPSEPYTAVIRDNDPLDGDHVLVVRVKTGSMGAYLTVETRKPAGDFEAPDAGEYAHGWDSWTEGATLLAQVVTEAQQVIARLEREQTTTPLRAVA